ncbi:MULTISPECIES: ATP-grasp domain-containing protein [unclassified Bradyrhizobium]|uniref:ATP-grasp domain-containing protein n=1 Tax=unclassified Bradyrhizobium TaxID=2631580 RepID=UPI001FF7E52B|nr:MULTISPECIES: ATP-grasp domain-containing protein [unclassified Bradyrhizobium]MCK1536075.1 ATP-grasp domain-containing protein [Bradyrhizobium sp. 176]MCK1557261.1 ATP-grasp domain-containing protein [Bradyrhizobium sp. 171]
MLDIEGHRLNFLTIDESRHSLSFEERDLKMRPVRHVLLLASQYALAYRGLRCFHAAGFRVSVMGTKRSKPLSRSRVIETFVLAKNEFVATTSELLVGEINDTVERLGVDMVAAADTPALRALIANKAALDARCFPCPDASQHGILDNKGAFRVLCQTEGVRIPRGFVVEDAGSIVPEIENCQIQWPVMLKPLAMEGGRGVIKVEKGKIDSALESLTYGTVLVEEFVPGTDVGISVYCEAGEIKASVCHCLEAGIYKVFPIPELENAVSRILKKLNCSGIYNFDARLERDGRTLLLECNPRFYNKMCLTLLAGLNLPEFAVSLQQYPPGTPARTVAYTPGAIVSAVLTSGRIPRAAAADAKFWMSDPVMLLYEMLRIPEELRSDTPGYAAFLVSRAAAFLRRSSSPAELSRW